jgi:hypothetical protein
MKSKLSRLSIVIAFANITLLFLGLNYCFFSIKSDFNGQSYVLIVFFSILLILLNLLIVSVENKSYIFFVLLLALNCLLVISVKKNDDDKIESIFQAISELKPLPKNLTNEQSKIGPQYSRWYYKNINEESFEVYFLSTSCVPKYRSYPNDKGWVISTSFNPNYSQKSKF